MAHAFLSASGAPAWLRCHAKPWREKGLPDSTNKFADEGTAAHRLLEMVIQGASLSESEGGTITVNGTNFSVNSEMVIAIAKTVEAAEALREDGVIYSEQVLDISFITGEEGAKGTADIVVLNRDTLSIVDLKYGMGVEVDAVDNEQLLIYGAAALEEFGWIEEIKTLNMVICQPRLNSITEWTLTVTEVKERIQKIREIAEDVLKGGEGLSAIPGQKQCRFCKVKSTCGEHRNFVLKTVSGGFVDLTKQVIPVRSVESSTSDNELATCMAATAMVEEWCKSVRAEVERRLLDGTFTDKRYKLVKGKQGNRAWVDAANVESQMKAMRLKVDEMYEMKIISPTAAEKLLKNSNPRKWAKLQESITRSEGRPSVAPDSDKRPALNISALFDKVDDVEFIESLAGLTITKESK